MELKPQCLREKYLAFRAAHRIDDIRAALAEGDGNPASYPHGEFFANRIAVLPCSTSLFDVKGNALCVEQLAFWPAHRLKEVCSDNYIPWQMYCLEHKSMQLERIALGRERALLRAAHAQWVVDPDRAAPLREDGEQAERERETQRWRASDG